MDTPLGGKLEIVFEVAWRIFSLNETPIPQLKEGSLSLVRTFVHWKVFFHLTQNARGPSRISVARRIAAARSNEVEGIEKITT